MRSGIDLPSSKQAVIGESHRAMRGLFDLTNLRVGIGEKIGRDGPATTVPVGIADIGRPGRPCGDSPDMRAPPAPPHRRLVPATRMTSHGLTVGTRH